ncbi:NAD(P)H-hydrate dehydratase [Sporolactobacillus sp. THM7-7]|nr:NAD(P)H-hydrate dehydratase [Sporolactobacillus sp. THM7-7]
MRVVTKEEMQAIDRYTMEHIGLGGPVLMENAGRAVYAALASELRTGEKVAVVIGKGNNGGDGFVISRQLMDSRASEETWLITDPERITGDAAYHMNAYLAAGGKIRLVSENPEAFSACIGQADLILDALLGTGFHGTPYPAYLQAIEAINHSSSRVISIDLPSGVPADGEPFAHSAVRADLTLTLACPKVAQFVQPAARYFGKVRTLSIGIPEAAMKKMAIRRCIWEKKDVIRTLPRRDPFSHKGSHGKGILIAGSKLMPGAAFFSAKAALRSGIGLLKVSVPDSVRQAVAAHLPETMFLPRASLDFKGASGLAIGPGLGRHPEVAPLLRHVLEYDAVPCVIDADGLYHLKGMLDLLKRRRKPAVLSPHPGELAHLLDLTVKEVEMDRFNVARAFAEKYRVYLVLKGKNTIITAPDGEQAVNPTGNASLAKGGSGDVLTGILLAFLLQHKKVMDAVCNAVYLHGAVADDLVRSEHSMLDVLASDLIDHIPPVLHQLYQDGALA